MKDKELKSEFMKIRVYPSMKRQFLDACHHEGLDASELLRIWMYNFIEKRKEVSHD